LPNLLAGRAAALHRAIAAMPDLPGMLARARQGVAERGTRLRLALPGLLAQRRAALLLGGSTLRAALRHAVAGRSALAARVLPRLSDAPVRARLREARARLDGAAAGLEALSYARVLERGFALVTDAAGAPVTTAAAIAPGARLRLKLADGEVRVTADGGRAATRQGTLAL
jgi:exodeoxyribonuclease VII large subunit